MNGEPNPMIDPVSGNRIPPGASANEVRDNVPILASENEYIIPADVVRFLGVEKIESLVNKAKESLAQLNQKGRIGGKPAGPGGNPMQRPPEPSNIAPPQPMGDSPRPPGMAEGGVVAQPTAGASQPTMMAYTGPDGRTVYIPFVNGQPLTPIPAGYQPMSQARQAVQPNRPSNSGGTSMLTTPGGNSVNQAKGPQEWTVDEFINYGRQLQSGIPDTIMGVVNTLFPLTNIITGLAERNMQATVPGMLDQMIETGIDPQGNPISEEQKQGLVETRTAMADRISQESGSRFNPFESLSNFVGRIVGGGRQPTTQSGTIGQAPPSGSESSGMGSPSFSVSGQTTSAPDKEEKQGSTKAFAYGGLVNKPAVGFLKNRAKGMTGVSPQPIIGGQPSGTGFIPPRQIQPN